MSKTDSEIAAIVREYVHASDHPDLVVYRRDFEDKFDLASWISILRKRCELGNFRNKRVLEVGCGFGWDAVGLALAGDNQVVATDILPSMIDGTRECLETMESRGHALPVTPVVADICSNDFEPGSFDGIFSSEAIEHVRDLQAMFSNCYRLLKPKGRLLIVNDSNRFNSEFREATFAMWRERDESWDHAVWLKDEVRPVEHQNAQPYAAMRRAIIEEVDPSLGSDDREALVAATAGMTRAEIIDTMQGIGAAQALPQPPEFSWCRNPETGEYAERLLDPFELRQMIRDAGFQNVRLRHGFNRFPHRLLNAVEFRPLNLFLFDRRGLFILIADKPG